MQIHIFGPIAKGMESNRELISIIKYYNVQYTLGILYIIIRVLYIFTLSNFP